PGKIRSRSHLRSRDHTHRPSKYGDFKHRRSGRFGYGNTGHHHPALPVTTGWGQGKMRMGTYTFAKSVRPHSHFVHILYISPCQKLFFYIFYDLSSYIGKSIISFDGRSDYVVTDNKTERLSF